MQPAFAGAHFSLADDPRAQLAQDSPVQPALGGHVLGIITLAVGIGAASGVYYGGPFGAVAGSLFGGAVANAYKAAMAYRMGTPDGDAEAKVSATYAVLAAALGGWVAYKFAKPRAGYEQNPEAEALGGGEGAAPPKSLSVKGEAQEKPGPCRPRRAYPVVSKACEEKP
jgi:hypothetical protein